MRVALWPTWTRSGIAQVLDSMLRVRPSHDHERARVCFFDGIRCSKQGCGDHRPTGEYHTRRYSTRPAGRGRINPLGNAVTSVFDAGNRLIATVDPLGNRTSFAYDASSRQSVGHGCAREYEQRRYMIPMEECWPASTPTDSPRRRCMMRSANDWRSLMRGEIARASRGTLTGGKQAPSMRSATESRTNTTPRAGRCSGSTGGGLLTSYVYDAASRLTASSTRTARGRR